MNQTTNINRVLYPFANEYKVCKNVFKNTLMQQSHRSLEFCWQ